MHVRVFPFAYPPIMGGAQGGASPTPTPPQYPIPYDLDSAAISATLNIEEGKWKTSGGGFVYAGAISLVGLVPKDLTDAALVEVTSGFSSITADEVELINDPAIVLEVRKESFTSLAIAVNNFGPFSRARLGTDEWNDKMAGKTAGGEYYVTLTVYDRDGNVLQTETWTEAIE